MSDQTASLALPLLAASQAQKHITHNEALTDLDALVQISVLDRTLTAPPGGAAQGDRYIPAGPATGAWAGQENTIAVSRDGGWVFYAPREGWLAWVADEDTLVGWDGGSWTGAGGPNAALRTLGINYATADATNRIAVNAPATLLNHDGNGHQLKLNKALAGDTISVLYQTNWSGRAEFGLTGDDNFHVKVSADGSVWSEAMVIAAGSGDVGIGTASPSTRLHIEGPVRCGRYSTAGRPSAATVGSGAMIYDTTLSKPVWSDGFVWRDAAGTAV